MTTTVVLLPQIFMGSARLELSDIVDLEHLLYNKSVIIIRCFYSYLTVGAS